MTGTGLSGTFGAFIRSIGEPSISSSSGAHLKNCWSERNSIESVAGLTSLRRRAK
jgi:hypothetical protein